MLNKVNGIFGTMLLGATALISPSSASAEQIALTFEEHDFTLVGEFAGYADNAYIVVTENGEIHVPAAMVSCAGTDCATASRQAAES